MEIENGNLPAAVASPQPCARDFAIAMHGSQMYSDRPYIYHLDAVAAVLVEFGLGGVDYLMDAAYLHDVMEDCGVTSESLWSAGFNRAWGIVTAVTDEPGSNRKERKRRTYPKIAGWEDATVVKLADRIANVRECLKSPHEKCTLRSMYANEYAEFYDRLWREDHLLAAPMWAELDRLNSGPETPSPIPQGERLRPAAGSEKEI